MMRTAGRPAPTCLSIAGFVSQSQPRDCQKLESTERVDGTFASAFARGRAAKELSGLFLLSDRGKVIGKASAVAGDVMARRFGKFWWKLVVALHLGPGLLDRTLRLVVAAGGCQDLLQISAHTIGMVPRMPRW